MASMQPHHLGPLLKKLGKRIGATVTLEPRWKLVGQIRFRSGKVAYFRFSTLDVNPEGAAKIAKDKDFASFFLKNAGFPVPTGEAFYSKEKCLQIESNRDIDAAYRYAVELGLPVVVKPNSGSQGSHVSIVANKRDFYVAMKDVFRHDAIALVQRVVPGRDYRVVVFDGKVMAAYERIPLNILGDGRSSVRALLKKKIQAFKTQGRDVRLHLEDPRIIHKLTKLSRTLASVPKRGERIFLRDNANLTAGGDMIDVTDRIHPGFKDIAVRATKEMGLRLCGVDFMIDGTIEDTPKTYVILEVNSSPGLGQYVTGGPTQRRVVEDLYTKILNTLDHA